MDKEFISIGEIVNTQGHRGYVRVYPLTDFPERFKKMTKVWVLLNGNREEMHIEDTYKHKKFVIIKFKEIPDMTAAENYKGALLQIEHQDITPLPKDTYYIFDIIGLDVSDIEGKYFGKVKKVLNTGANDVYVVDYLEEKRDLLIPAIKQVVKEINLSKRIMKVELPEGL
ncbi:ribosome maturation factor RimM [Desulfolucanica intricata]|uniref:ribosome maturation factor RimM n=1 Tax=Desulfolucanica intricata TaxID=1285191 RepID=UPI00082C5476|nr:ribosome maturation factor RimM [Desulfolucanica intricata]